MELAIQERNRTEEFEERVAGMMNAGALALMASIGHRTRLFDTMDGMEPATSREIADRAGLDERYVREWLGAMVVGDVVRYDPGTARYSLPAEHAACLTRAATPNNLAAMTQYFGVLAGVEDRIVECFENGGGVPYGEFHRFHEVMAEDSGQTVLPVLESAILPLAPGLVLRLERGIDVLDVGCGSGRAAVKMGWLYPKSAITGYDLCEEAVVSARAEAARAGTKNVRFETRDVSRLGETDRFDLITAFDAIHDQAAPDAVLRGIHEALRPGGVFLMQDIRGSRDVEKNRDHPLGALLYTISCMHCMTVSLAQGGAGLGTMWGEETALAMLEGAGFEDVELHHLPHDIQNAYFVARKG